MEEEMIKIEKFNEVMRKFKTVVETNKRSMLILRTVLFEIKNNMLYIVGTDLRTILVYKQEINHPDVMFCIEYKKLLKIKGDVELSIDDGFVDIFIDNIHMKLEAIDAGNYPVYDSIFKKGKTVNLTKEMKQGFQQSHRFISQDSHYSVYTTWAIDKGRICTCDGKIAYLSKKLFKFKKQILICKFNPALIKLANTMTIHDTMVVFSGDNYIVKAHLHDGKFPEVDAVFNNSKVGQKKLFKVTQRLINDLSFLKNFCDKNSNKVEFSFNQKEINLLVNPSYEERVEIFNTDEKNIPSDADFKIAFNVKLLIEILRINKESVVSCSGSKGPAFIDNGLFKTLIMPLRISRGE